MRDTLSCKYIFRWIFNFCFAGRAKENTSVNGPINPQNITNIIIHFPNADNFAVIPIVNPTVPNAEIVSNSN